MRTLESWFDIIEVAPTENLWKSPEPTIHIRSERLTWTLTGNNQVPGAVSQNGVLKIDYIPEDAYLVPATLTAFLSNFTGVQFRSAGSLLKIIFNAIRSRIGEVSLTISLEYEDSFGNIELLTLSSGDFPQVQEANFE